MYQPEHFRTADSDSARDLLRDYPFATLLTASGSEINPLPLLIREDIRERIVLEGHVAAGNPVAESIKAGAEVTALFQGPQAYISPLWYVSPGQVPTWNYAVVHVRGKFAPIEGADETLRAMERFVRRFEGDEGWSMESLSPRARDGLLAAIRYFRIEVVGIDAKMKLSQNRSPEDRASVLKHLESSIDPRRLEMAVYLRRANGLPAHS